MDVAVLTRAISACGAAGEPAKALALLQEMEKRVGVGVEGRASGPCLYSGVVEAALIVEESSQRGLLVVSTSLC